MRLTLALAWRNLWRNPRRTFLSAGAVAFMVFMLIFVLSMQLGSYDTMVDHAASVMHGHAQVQREEYVDQPRVRYVLNDAEAIADALRASEGVRAATGVTCNLAQLRPLSASCWQRILASLLVMSSCCLASPPKTAWLCWSPMWLALSPPDNPRLIAQWCTCRWRCFRRPLKCRALAIQWP